MTASRLHQQLIEDGYTVVPGVLSPDDVAVLREVCGRQLQGTGTDTILASAFLRIPELAQIPFSRPVIESLKAALDGEFVMVPEFNVQAGRSGAWHFDASAIRDAEWVNDPDYLQVECAVYLQDAHPVYAGGLGVVPRSHRVPFSGLGLGSLPARIMRRLSILFGESKAVPTCAGDLLIWDFRLLHRGIPPSAASTPEALTKYGIFFGAAAKARHASFYMKNIKERGERGELFYRDIAGLRFPESYPDDLVARCKADGILVASL